MGSVVGDFVHGAIGAMGWASIASLKLLRWRAYILAVVEARSGAPGTESVKTGRHFAHYAVIFLKSADNVGIRASASDAVRASGARWNRGNCGRGEGFAPVSGRFSES